MKYKTIIQQSMDHFVLRIKLNILNEISGRIGKSCYVAKFIGIKKKMVFFEKSGNFG